LPSAGINEAFGLLNRRVRRTSRQASPIRSLRSFRPP
jgi:hypothetical protein